MLTLDGHDSHETRKIKRAAFDHNVIIIVLPSKMTHKLQPLDVGVFSSVQRKWSRHCDERLAQGVQINRFNFIPEYLAIHRTLCPSLVQKAFAKTGIYPLNPNIFDDHEYTPSQTSSSMPTFPPSYPDEAPPAAVPLDPSNLPANMSGGLGDQDDLGSPNNDHSLLASPASPASPPPPPSLSTDYITHPVPIVPHQPMPVLPQLPPYDHLICRTL